MEFPGGKDGLSTPSDSSLGGGYLDVAPDSHIIFHRPTYPGAEPKPSTAKTLQKKSGIYSQDPLLDRSPDEVWRFLVANLKPPRLFVDITGSCQRYQVKPVARTDILTHFSVRIEVSVTQWSQLYAHPHQLYACPDELDAHPYDFRTNRACETEKPTLRETVEEYTSSRNPFKESQMRKVVLWDIERVEKSIQELVHSLGYRHFVYVKFPVNDYKVVALLSNEYSRSAHSRLVRGLCCLSCLCIVFGPAWCIARKRMNRLTCEYRTTQSADQFLAANSSMIRSAVLANLVSGY